MKVLAVSLPLLCCFISLILAAETSTNKSAEASDNKEKRGTATVVSSYATAKPATVTNADNAYATAKLPKVSYGQQTQLQYISQPQQLLRYKQLPQQQVQQQQHQYYYEQQPVATAVKYSAAPAKITYTSSRQNPNQIQYSLASDVSSFSYSSPLVEYNNLGLLTQHIGKLPVSAVQTAAAPHHQQQQQQQQQLAYRQAMSVPTNTKPQQVAYQQHVPQQQVAYQAVAQPAPVKVSTAYVVAQPQYRHGGQIQQVAYVPAAGADQQQAHYAYTQIPQQYSTGVTTRAHQAEDSAEPQYIAIPAHHGQQQIYYAQQQSIAPQAQQYTREQYAQALQANAQPQIQYQHAQEPTQYSGEHTVSTAGGTGGQHSVPQAAYSSAPEYYRDNGQYEQGYQYQQGKYGGQQVGVQYA